jgi:type IV pilus assembly protein PilY1
MMNSILSTLKYSFVKPSWVVLPLVLTLFSAQPAIAQPVQKPQFLTSNAPPLIMLTMSRDHKLFYEAYNDWSDINGDGIIDQGYQGYRAPTDRRYITYYGLFDSFKCYNYSTGDGRFQPISFTANKRCSGAWSGDFLNYLTTSRIDALRKVLYGGMRSTDTATLTVLERAYVPQDAHSWGKEWTSVAVDGYNIADFAPLSAPANNNRIFFANVTNLAGGSSRNSTEPPLLKVWVTNDNRYRIWDWLSIERPVAGSAVFQRWTGNRVGITPTSLNVRVAACVTGLLEDECVPYQDTGTGVTSYKPQGILHEFGQAGAMNFGLLTGSYDRPNEGGRLRKNVESFVNEVDPATGQFTSVRGIVYNINRLRVESFGGTNAYDCGWTIADPAINNTNCADWGNPLGELMYEGLRYFSGKVAGTAAFTGTATRDNALGLTAPTWRDPFRRTGNPSGAPYCSKPVQMVFGDVTPSFDSDQLPGSAFGSFSGDLSGLSVSSLANTISAREGISGDYFVGETTASGATGRGIPSSKTITGLGTIRGIAPEEPSRAGSYYSAAVALFGKGTDLRTDLNDNGWAQTLDTYSIALASPLPRIQIPFRVNDEDRLVTILPFAKSPAGYGISAAATSYQPTNQIVDFYIDRILNQPGWPTDATVNGGRPHGKFRINFEDVEQGADHDMDAIALYEYNVNADGTLTVSVDAREYAAGSIVQHMGYIIDGINKVNGVETPTRTFLEVRDCDTGNTTWPVAGVPETSCGIGMPPRIHGLFLPAELACRCERLRRLPSAAPQQSSFLRIRFGTQQNTAALRM